MGQEYKSKSRSKDVEEEVDEQPTSSVNEELNASTEDVLDKIDEELGEDTADLLDEIDELLEPNAQEFVAAFVQKGGQ